MGSIKRVSGSAGIAGIGDLFDQETADTLEVGVKASSSTVGITASLSVYHTTAKGSYYFVFDPNTSTQNLGNLGKVHYDGLRGRSSPRAAAEGFDTYVRFGYTDSEIKESSRAADGRGQSRRRSSPNTPVNLGAQYRKPFGHFGLSGVIRAPIRAHRPNLLVSRQFHP